MTGLEWGIRSLVRRPLRTVLSIAGIAVTGAMLLDMVMLSGGIERTFADLQSSRGYQVRLTARGTAPFDTETTFPDATNVVAALRQDPAVEAAGAVLGASLHARFSGDSLVSLVGYGLQPEAQPLYQLAKGHDLTPTDTAGILLSQTTAKVLHVGVNDTISVMGRLDPQLASAIVERKLVVRGIVRWIYDAHGQRSVGTVLPVMQQLSGTAGDRASMIAVKIRDGEPVEQVVEQLRSNFPKLTVNSVADLVVFFRKRLVYFWQLSYLLGATSLGVTVLLIGTLLTITVNERRGEIATLRAIGVSRGGIVRQVLAEGVVLTVIGGLLGAALGMATARYLDSILTTFPGLPAAFSFFVPRTNTIATAAGILLVTGSLAGVYPAWLAARSGIAMTLRSEAS